MPDNSQELQILIRAQNLTQQAFEQARNEMRQLGQTSQQTNKLVGGLTQGLTALGIGFSVGAVVSFGKEILDTADHLQKMADKLSISTDEVQQLDYIAGQSGNTLDQMTNALSFMQDAIGSESSGLLAVLRKTGVTFDDLKKMSPYEQMRTLAQGIASIEDPAERAAAATDSFGRAGREVLPTLIADWQKLGDQAPKMSKEAVAGLDALGDAVTSVWTRIKAAAGETIATDIVKPFQETFSQKEADRMERWANSVGLSFRKLGADVSDLYSRFQILSDGVTNLPKAPSAPDLFKATPSIAPTKLSADDVKGIENALNAERKALDETAKAADQHAKKIKEMQDALFGRTAIQNANDYIQALGKFQNLTRLSADDQKKLNAAAKEALEAFQRNGQAATTAIVELYNRTVRMPDAVDGISESVKNLGHEVEVVIPTLYEMPKAIAFTPEALKLIEFQARTSIPEIPKQTKIAKVSIDDMARSIEQLANISGGSFSGIARDIGSIVGAAAAAEKAIKLMRDSGKATDKLEGILSMTTGLMGIVTAAVQAGKAIASLFDRNKGRDLVVDFAETFGGFDELHKKLLELGDEGEALWIKLTQGVGRNNPEQAKAAIEEVTKALEKQKQKTGDVGDVTEEAAAATIETATQASEALKTVGEQLETNKGQWHDWSDSVMADIKRVADSLGAVVVPAPTATAALPGFAGGTHGAYLDFGAGTPVMLHGRERVMTASEGASNRPLVVNTSVQVEGREIARASSRYQRAVLAPYGVR